MVKKYEEKILFEEYCKKNRKKKKYKKYPYKGKATVTSGSKSVNLTYFKHTY